MATNKRVSGSYTIETLESNASITLDSTDVVITGNLTVDGDAVLLGNIEADRIFNGNSNVEISTASGPITVGVNGVSNVAVFTETSAAITGTFSATGTVSVGNSISAAGNITGANINTAGNVFITRDAALGQPTIRFVDSNTVPANSRVFGTIEWFTSRGAAPGPRVNAGIRAIADGEGGNATVQILTADGNAAPSVRVAVLRTGNVGIANNAPNHTLAVSGTMFGSSTLSVVGNVTGGNISTAGLANVATLEVTTLANIKSTTAATSTTTGALTVSGGAGILGNIYVGGGVFATGNVSGGNVNSIGGMSATGDITASNFFVINSGNVTVQGNTTANNATISNSLTTKDIVITGSSSGTGIGVENTVRQSTTAVIAPSAVANVGVLGFTALENLAYKFSALLPVTLEGSTTATFALQFSQGTCNYVVEAQETATSLFSVASSNTSDLGISRTMTGTDLRFVRITGTFRHTGNVDVAVRASTSAANINILGDAYLSFTRTG